MMTAENKEAVIQKMIVYPSCVKSCPDIPFNIRSGINTTQVVSVPPVIEPIIVRVPSSAAS